MNDTSPTATGQKPSADEMIARAKALAPVFRARSLAAEDLRRVPDETIADIVAAQFPRICQPGRYGGFEMGWDVLCRCSTELGRGCGAQAWVANVFAEHNFLTGLFPEEAQDEVWGQDSTTVVSTSFIPVGNDVKEVDGGFVLDGRWPFSSGVHHAGWTIVGEMVPQPGGSPQHHFFLVPARDREIVDDWHAMGLAGTGSCTVELKNCFVPRHRALANELVRMGKAPGAQASAAPIYRMPLIGFANLALASVAVGIAAGIVDDFTAAIKKRVAAAPPRPGLENLQARIAESAAEVQAARLLIGNRARANMAVLEAGDFLGEEEEALTIRDAPYAATLARRAATRLFESTGAHGLFLDGHVQRAFRDVFAATVHAGLAWDRAANSYGRHALGLAPIRPF